MEFKLIDKDNKDFTEATIGLERAKMLSMQLDVMVTSWSKSTQLIRLTDIMVEIADFCLTPEELTWCVINHMGWHQRRGNILTSM